MSIPASVNTLPSPAHHTSPLPTTIRSFTVAVKEYVLVLGFTRECVAKDRQPRPRQGGPSTVTNPSSPGQPGKGSPPPAWPLPQKSPTPGQPKPGTKEPGPPQPQKSKDPLRQPPKK